MPADGRSSSLVFGTDTCRHAANSDSTDVCAGYPIGQWFRDVSPDEGGLRRRCVRESPRRVDPDLAHEVAARFQAARSNQTNRTVRAAYDQLARQSDAIFARLTDADHPLHSGLRVEFTRCESPYDSDDELIRAVRTHRVLEITTSAMERDRRHPLLGCERGGAYDRFRAVHDIVGHVGPCLGFDRNGEFAAWLTQEQLYDGLARWALATELHAEHSVRWTTGTLSDHKATLIDRDLLNKVRSVSSNVVSRGDHATPVTDQSPEHDRLLVRPHAGSGRRPLDRRMQQPRSSAGTPAPGAGTAHSLGCPGRVPPSARRL